MTGVLLPVTSKPDWREGGDSRAEALTALAEVLRLEDGGGDPIDKPDGFLRTELSVDPDDLTEHDELPEFMQ